MRSSGAICLAVGVLVAIVAPSDGHADGYAIIYNGQKQDGGFN